MHKPVKYFEVKWSGVLNMVGSYFIYRPHLNSDSWVNSPIIALLPTPVEERQLRKCLTDLKHFQSVSLLLQTKGTPLSDAQNMFTWLATKFPDTACKLLPEFTTKRLNRNFESAIVKIQNNTEHLLTVEESEAMAPFLIALDGNDEVDVALDDEAEDDHDDVHSMLKRARKDIPAAVGSTKYINLSFIQPTSNCVERLFSRTRKVWREDRKKMTPSHMEMLMFLTINRDLWDEMLVWKCRTNPRRRQNLDALGARLAEDLIAVNQGGEAAADIQNPLAAAEALEAFRAELDNENMEDHRNVFLPNGDDADQDLWDDMQYWEDAVNYFEAGY
jgi:hypothetical protein